MQRGDTVVAINGRDAELMSYRQWDEIVRGNKSVTIGWAHDGRQRSQLFPILELK